MQELTFDEIELVSGGQPAGGLSWQVILSDIGELLFGKVGGTVGFYVGQVIDNWDTVSNFLVSAWDWASTQVNNFIEWVKNL